MDTRYISYINAGFFCSFLLGCTTVDDSLTPEEQADLDASENFESASGDLILDKSGNYSFKGEELVSVSQSNGQSIYGNIEIDGKSYTLITAQHDYGMSLYAVGAEDQFTDIGHAKESIGSPSQLSSVHFAGKYYERNVNGAGQISPQYSAAIVLELDVSQGTLDTITGPSLNYGWDEATQGFVGREQTEGSVRGYVDNSLLGNYKLSDQDTQTYGAFWAKGE